MSWPWSLSPEVPSAGEGNDENTRTSSVQHQQSLYRHSTAATGTSTVSSQAYLQLLEQQTVTHSTAAMGTSTVSSQAYLQHVQQQRVSGLYALHQQHAPLPAVPGPSTPFPVTSTAQMHPRFTRDLSSWFISEPQITSPSGSFTNTLFQQIPPSMSRDQTNTETFLHTSEPQATSQHVPVTSAAFNFPITDITESQFSSRPLEQGQWRRSLGNYESNNPENVQQGNLENGLIYQPFTPGNISRILPLGQQSNPGFRNSQTPIGLSEQGQFNIVNLLRTNRPVCLTHQSNYPGTHQYHQSSLQPEQQALPSVIPSGTTLSTAHQSLPGYSQCPRLFQNQPSESHLSQFTAYPSIQHQPVSPESSTSTPLTEAMITASSRTSVSSEVTAVTEEIEQEDPLLQGIQ